MPFFALGGVTEVKTIEQFVRGSSHETQAVELCCTFATIPVLLAHAHSRSKYKLYISEHAVKRRPRIG